jgi:predicted RND superfamily exporter protein
MKKIANFLVKNRFVALVIMLVVTIICGVLAATVPINKDRTKYLADDSNMKQGIAIMEVAFPETKDTAAIRVMFDDLTTEQIANVKARLEAIPNVSEVIYEADNEKYNKENHTLFVVHADFGYNTDEEVAIEKAIETGFPEYTMVYKNNDIPLTELPIWIILLGLSLAIIILIVISSSWLDPVLFLVTIGIAIIINFGTNVIFPYTDELTITVGPILQLVLSMDYSIILMNRYRQEKDKSSNKIEAMKTALAGSISSIASSSLTTVVGLLALVFLSFKLGPELGIVLAKGVFISMLSVFTVLPVMILSMDKWLEKTRKKSPHISMRLLTKISYKIRHAMPIIFVILLVGSFILQRSVTITFTEDSEDQLVDVFPKDNTIVIVYNNEDEGNINGIVTELEKDNRVSSVLGYSNTLGKAMDAEEMSEAINEFDGKERIDKNIVSMIYFIAADGELPTLTVVEFMNFIVDSVIPNETLNAYVDNNIRDNIEYFEKFSDKEKLTTALTIEEMADFFGIEKERVEQLYLYYTIQNGVADSGKMTLPTFIDFVLNPNLRSCSVNK